ncbi:MAG: transposase zinc-binding domain-containing protein, partial [Clostridia bacterium]
MKYLTFRKINSKSLSEQVPYFVSAQESYPVFSVEYKALASEVDKLRHCGDFIHTVECDDCGTNHYKGYNRCKSKFCLTCNHVKSGIWTASLIQYLKNYLQLGDSAFLMTFT